MYAEIHATQRKTKNLTKTTRWLGTRLPGVRKNMQNGYYINMYILSASTDSSTDCLAFNSISSLL